ncbi:MAG: primosomal protein N' [Pirellulaceae bacterium]|nr:primosomal protein N' [Pirellulaceae bacterium]
MGDKKQIFLFKEKQTTLQDQNEVLTASVVFSEGPAEVYSYLIPERLRKEVCPGKRIKVPLGRANRKMIGYCVALEKITSTRRLKEIDSVLDETTLLNEKMIEMTAWMAEQFLAPWGQILESVVPAGVREQAGVREKTYLFITDDFCQRWQEEKLSPKQRKVLELVAKYSGRLSPGEVAHRVGSTVAPIQSLRKRGILDVIRKREMVAEVKHSQVQKEGDKLLSPQQTNAKDQILKAVYSKKQKTLLLHGVTGSGKTEVYIQAIQEIVRAGQQAIVLVPEISLTPQTRHRFQARFDSVAVLHSHLSASERHAHWQNIASGKVQVVVGARSAIFAPVPQLGLIVLDEEHEPSFKQDTAPRYHAREIAFFRAQQEGVPLVLGSATPSLESWYKASVGEYQLLSMPDRVAKQPLPSVSTVDLREESKNRGPRGAIARKLYLAMKEALREKGQVILLLNRRGHDTHIQCHDCGAVVACPDCDIALTYHLNEDRLSCHYCDYQQPAPKVCTDCQQGTIRYGGLGTQKLEIQIQKLFPNHTSLRMDTDTMKKAGSHEEALAKFRKGEVDILLGTQMIAKGLDFPNVTLVGVINADTALHFPDFRSAERTFQLVTQVAGRTGRGEREGHVLVQTYSPDHPAIMAAVKHDFEMFAATELPARKEFGYPPFGTLVRVVVRSDTEKKGETFSDQLADYFEKEANKEGLSIRMLGPIPAPIAKIRGKFRFHFMLQADLQTQQALKRIGQSALRAFKRIDPDVQWIIDINPMEML